jgi:hypothetical protein
MLNWNGNVNNTILICPGKALKKELCFFGHFRLNKNNIPMP